MADPEVDTDPCLTQIMMAYSLCRLGEAVELLEKVSVPSAFADDLIDVREAARKLERNVRDHIATGGKL